MNTYDPTKTAVLRQLKGMNADSYDIGLLSRDSKKLLPRVFTSEQVVKAIPWLKSKNLNNNDIFIRPSGEQNSGLIFFDDLNKGTIEKLNSDGLSPAVLIESSPTNYHGWLRIRHKAIDNAIATAMCKLLAKRYNGDVDSADWRHYGRLAGFTNRKAKHIQRNGQQPFVLLTSYNGKICENAIALEKRAIAVIKEERAQLAMKKAARKSYVPPKERQDAYYYYRTQLNGIIQKYGSQTDNSRADWMIITKMVRLGYSDEELTNVLEKNSPALDSRTGREEAYILTTISNARNKA